MINAQKIDDLSENDRNRRDIIEQASQILSNKIWFELSKCREILERLNKNFIQIHRCYENSKETNDAFPFYLFLSGDTNTGKTTLAVKFMEYYKIVENEIKIIFSDDDIRYFELPIKITLKELLSVILEKFGIRIRGVALNNIDNELLINRIIKELNLRKVKFLIFDDIQNILKVNNEMLKEIFKVIDKILSNAPTRFIFIGNSKEIDFIKNYIKPKDYFIEMYIPPLKYNEEYLNLLYTLYKIYKNFLPNWDLIDNQGYINQNIAKYLFKLSMGRVGALIQTIRYAAVYALLQKKSNISVEDYEKVQPIKFVIKNGKILQKLRAETNKEDYIV